MGTVPARQGCAPPPRHRSRPARPSRNTCRTRTRRKPARRFFNTRFFQLFTDIAPRYKDRAKDAPGGNGGYTRIVKMPARRGDAAPQAVLLLVE